MLEQLEVWGWSPKAASMVFGALLGLAFGVLAQRSRFCLRRGLVGEVGERQAALGVWVMALAAAILGTTIAVEAGWLQFAEHRFHAASQPLLAIIVGGALFGAGMLITRGCVSRLTVLAGSGNMRALVAILVFAVTAHATLKGALAPIRTSLSSVQADLGVAASWGEWPGGALLWAGLAVAALILIAARSGARPYQLVMATFIGALVPIGWLGTGHLLADEFDPIAMESLAFTSSASDALFWWVAGTAIKPGFGVGLFGGVLVGAALASLLTQTFEWTGFSEQTPTHRYLIGGAMMGIGGATAGGCTVGAGLSGVATLSTAALLTLVSIIAGALIVQSLPWAVRQRQGQRGFAMAPAE